MTICQCMCNARALPLLYNLLPSSCAPIELLEGVSDAKSSVVSRYVAWSEEDKATNSYLMSYAGLRTIAYTDLLYHICISGSSRAVVPPQSGRKRLYP
jgi:hypothetical protein